MAAAIGAGSEVAIVRTIRLAVAASTRPVTQEDSPAQGPQRPPTYESYKPPRTTAEGGATMLLSGVFAAAGMGVLLLAVATKLFNLRTFGQINNLLMFAVALLLLAIFVLLWEITLRLIARAEE